MRWLVIAAIAALSSLGVNASEPVALEAPTAEAAVAMAQQDPVVTAIPMPAKVTVLIEDLNAGSKLKPAKKLKAAKQQTLPKSMLSRTERHQMAILAAATPKAGEGYLRELFDDEDGGSGAEDIDLHRSFSRPQVAKALEADQDDEALAAAPEISIRLLLARMKAVEARVLVEAADRMDDQVLSDVVMRRLHLARTKAVAAHQKKFT